jgi:SOS-response transcriptional repressor LexA
VSKTDELLKYVEEQIRTKGEAPKRRDIMKHFGWASPSVTEYHIKKLVKSGHLKSTGKMQGLIVTNGPMSVSAITERLARFEAAAKLAVESWGDYGPTPNSRAARALREFKTLLKNS